VLTIAVVDKSTKLKDHQAELKQMVYGVNRQMHYHVAPAWGRSPANVALYTDETLIPAGSYTLYMFDDSDQAGALGYHTEEQNGKIDGKVFINPILNNKGSLTQGAFSVSGCLSHEVIEAFGDPYCNYWVDMSDKQQVALELCDPVENDFYYAYASPQLSAGPVVAVSNFVFPEWFDWGAAKTARFDLNKRVTAPFQMLKNGYMVIRGIGGNEQNVFGDKYPEWRKATKDSPLARTFKRAHKEPNRDPPRPSPNLRVQPVRTCDPKDPSKAA
jgi:hypothetical protein